MWSPSLYNLVLRIRLTRRILLFMCSGSLFWNTLGACEESYFLLNWALNDKCQNIAKLEQFIWFNYFFILNNILKIICAYIPATVKNFWFLKKKMFCEDQLINDRSVLHEGKVYILIDENFVWILVKNPRWYAWHPRNKKNTIARKVFW